MFTMSGFIVANNEFNMSKRKADEFETTCDTWLTTRNKKQDLKEFESNLQRSSQRRASLLKFSRRPVGLTVTNVKQSKLSDFFPNINSGKENSCTNHYDNVIEKGNKKIKGQVTTIDGIWTNVKFEDASSNDMKLISTPVDPASLLVNRGCCHDQAGDTSTLPCEMNRFDLNTIDQHSVLDYDEDSSARTIEGGRASITEDSRIRTIEGSTIDADYKASNKKGRNYTFGILKSDISSLDTFELSLHKTGYEITPSPYLDSSDNCYRNSSNYENYGIRNSEMSDRNTVQTPEKEFNESFYGKMNVDVITGHKTQENTCEGHQSFPQPDVISVSTIIEETSETIPEDLCSLSGKFGMTQKSEPSIGETLPNDDYSLGSLRFTIDSEEPILKLRESCLNFEDPILKLQESCLYSENPVLKLGESCLDSKDPILKLQESCLDSEDPILKLQESCLDSEDPILKLRESCLDSGNAILKLRESCLDSENPILKLQESCLDSENPILKLGESCLDSEDPIIKNITSQEFGWNKNHKIGKKPTKRLKTK